jgi:hypothetical protein
MLDADLPGPLGEMARQAHARSGIDAHDAFAAAVCWWSASIAPAIRLSHEPVLVWGVFLSDEDQYFPSVITAVHDVGFEDEAFGPPHLMPPFSKRRLLETLQTAEPGHERSLLLAGDPLRRLSTSHRISFDDDSFLRQAWDGKEYRPHKYQSTPVTPPLLGVLWEAPTRAWQQSTHRTDPATLSRLLLFRRRPAEPAAEPLDMGGTALTELAQARAWAFHQRHMSLDTAAGKMLDVIRRHETTFDSMGPAEALIRIGSHTRRVAAALAVAERSAVIRPEHLLAGWAVARRSCRDIQSLLRPSDTRISRVVEEIDRQLRTMNLRSAVIPHPLSGHEAGSLLAQTEADTAKEAVAEGEAAVASVRRRSMVVESQVRDSHIVKTVKRWYGNYCQMCGNVLRIPGPASAYSEGAHILALGHPHNGPDRIENLLCLCPNCHTLFDNGALYLTDDLHVVDAFTHNQLRKLTVVPQHNIDTACVRQHREYWTTDHPLAAAASAERERNQGL